MTDTPTLLTAEERQTMRKQISHANAATVEMARLAALALDSDEARERQVETLKRVGAMRGHAKQDE